MTRIIFLYDHTPTKHICFVYGTKFFILSQQVQRKVRHFIKHLKEKEQKKARPTFSKVSTILAILLHTPTVSFYGL